MASSEVYTVAKCGGRNFKDGVKYAKKRSGTYNSTTQEWIIAGDHTDCVPLFFVSARLVNSPAPTCPTEGQVLRDMDRNENSIY